MPGLGGLDGALAGRNQGEDRACVHASTELTDAQDFLARFRRTLAYQKLAAISERDGAPLPDARLEALFAHLVHATRPGHDQRLRLAPVAPGVYEADLLPLPAGRWRLILEDPRREWKIVKEGL